MATLFLLIIYLTFISLGLPDSLLGTAWPVMQAEFALPVSFAGYVSFIISGGTILSSLFSAVVLSRFGTGKVTFVSVLMTAAALLGFSFAPSFGWLMVLAVPLGLGAGAVDSGLNDFVAQHYAARHMSWLHCFWGVGATLSPIVMAAFIARDGAWRSGYFTISLIQFALVIVLFFALPLWARVSAETRRPQPEAVGEAAPGAPVSLWQAMCVRGVPLSMITFLFYCALETTVGLWGASYLVSSRGMAPDDAARWVSLYFGGITLGRLISGFITMRLSSKALIRWGLLLIALGVGIILLPLDAQWAALALVLTGLGCAPVFPCMLHETPARFGTQAAQRIMGLQMACAYMGSTLMPPVLGALANFTGIGIFPWALALYTLMMVLGTERINRFLTKNRA